MPYLMTVIAILTTISLFSSLTSASFAAPKRGSVSFVSAAKTEALTRLRAQQPVVVRRAMRGGFEIRHVNVEVTNVGSSPATGVQVSLEQVGGVAHTLRGPKNLAPHERGLYVSDRRLAASSASWHVVTRCSSCRR